MRVRMQPQTVLNVIENNNCKSHSGTILMISCVIFINRTHPETENHKFHSGTSVNDKLACVPE